MSQSASMRPRGRPKASTRSSESSRAELLDAAAELFAERGFDGASVREVCERAGLSKGTFYWTFPSKDALFDALVEDRIEAPIRSAIEALRNAPSSRDMSEETNRRFLEAMRGDRTLILLDDEFWRRATREPRARERYARRQRELRSALAGALEERRRELGAPEFGTPPEHLAITYLALLSGLARSRLIDPDALPDGLFGEFLALTFAGLVARAGGTS